MKYTIASVMKQARELAGALPVTRQNCRLLAAKIYGHDAQQENIIGGITQRFTRAQINAWFDEVLLLPEYQEHAAWEIRLTEIKSDSDWWLETAVAYVLQWQKNAALMPLTRAFTARIKEENA